MDREDIPFISSAWLNSFRNSPVIGGMRADEIGNTFSGHQDHAIVQNPQPSKKTFPLMLTLHDKVYFDEHRRCVIEPIIQRARMDICCASDDPSIIIAFTATEDLAGIPVIHFVYTKKDFRRRGIIRWMLQTQGITAQTPLFFSHHPIPVIKGPDSRMVSRWQEGWLRNSSWTWNPYAIFPLAPITDATNKEV
jgi:hypothetical protein